MSLHDTTKCILRADVDKLSKNCKQINKGAEIMIFNQYKLTWTYAFFGGNGALLSKFRIEYKRKFRINNYFENKVAIWCFDKIRADWIVENLPKSCYVEFLQITDKQFGDKKILYGKKGA